MKCVSYNSARSQNDILVYKHNYKYQQEILSFLFEKKNVSIYQVDKSVWPTELNIGSLFYIES